MSKVLTLKGREGKSVVVEGVKGYFSSTVISFDPHLRHPHLVNLAVSETVTLDYAAILTALSSYLEERHHKRRFVILYTNWETSDSRLHTLTEVADTLSEEFPSSFFLLTHR